MRQVLMLDPMQLQNIEGQGQFIRLGWGLGGWGVGPMNFARELFPTAAPPTMKMSNSMSGSIRFHTHRRERGREGKGFLEMEMDE